MEGKKKTPFENIIANSKSLSDLSGLLGGKFNWFKPTEHKRPVKNAIAIAELPVQIIYKWVKNYVIDIDEDGYEIKYTGYIMEVLPNQKFLAKDYKHLKIIGQASLSA